MKAEPILKVVGDDGAHHQPRPLGEADTWRLRISLGDPKAQGEGGVEELTLPQLIQWAETSGAAVTVERGIQCVSAGGIAGARGSAVFTGLPFAALAARAGLASPATVDDPTAGPTVEFLSRAAGTCGPKSRRHSTTLPLSFCLDPTFGVMLVWRLNGEPLPYPNGGPLRSAVGPRLFFYKGIKWLEEIRLHDVPPTEMRGTWETYAGYHNLARTEFDERFEPVLLQIAEVVQGPAGEEDRLDEIPRKEWREVFEDAYRRRNLSRLVAAQLHQLLREEGGGSPFPKDFAGVVFSDGPYRAKIRGTSFASADFTGACMEGVNLSLSKLTNARFSDAGADPAILAEGDFEGTYFNNAHLRNVDMRRATLTGATFFAEKAFDRPTDRVQGLDVRGAKNLDPRTADWLRRNGAVVD